MAVTMDDVKWLDISEPKQRALVRLLTGELSPYNFPCLPPYHHYPSQPEHNLDAIMQVANWLLGGHGVEGLYIEEAYINSYYGNIVASYVNMGDTYDTTVVLDHENGEFFITSYGDWLDAWENEQEMEWEDEPHEYEVIVGNIGTVYSGENHELAVTDYNAYVCLSKTSRGHRCYGEDVYLMRNGHPNEEYSGHLSPLINGMDDIWQMLANDGAAKVGEFSIRHSDPKTDGPNCGDAFMVTPGDMAFITLDMAVEWACEHSKEEG